MTGDEVGHAESHADRSGRSDGGFRISVTVTGRFAPVKGNGSSLLSAHLAGG